MNGKRCGRNRSGLIWSNIPAYAWRDWQRSQLSIRTAGLRAGIPTRGLLNSKQQWHQIDSDGRPPQYSSTSFSRIPDNPCFIWWNRSQPQGKVSALFVGLSATWGMDILWISLCLSRCVVLRPADPLSKESYRMYNHPTKQPTSQPTNQPTN